MIYETNCTEISIDRWNELMRGARKVNYKRMCREIKKNLPELYKDLALDFHNPYAEQSRQTKTHYVLVSSAIEYFILK